MSSALDRLAALAAGTAPVVSLRPRARFEGPARVEEPVVVDDEESPAPSSPLPAELPAPASVEQVFPAPALAVTPASAASVHARAAEGESAVAAVVTTSRRTRAPVAAAAPGNPPAAMRPQSPPPPAPVSEPPAVRTTARRPAPEPPPADVEPPPPDVLLEQHIVPVLVREQVVQRTAVPGPSRRTDVEVVEILGEPWVERVRGEPPQVHVHIGEVRVSPPAPPGPAQSPGPAQPPARPAPPDLDAYLAARREGRP